METQNFCKVEIPREQNCGGVCGGQAWRFRLRSSSQAWPLVFIQFDASSSEDPSKISSEGVPSSTAHTDQTAACGAFRMVSFGSSWSKGPFSKILAMAVSSAAWS
jgi:hypothetical protein